MRNAHTSLNPGRAGRALRAASLHGQRGQRGVVVFIALIVLVAMTLAGLAVMRSSDSTVLTAGNLALRQTATVAADRGVEKAVEWLVSKGPVTLQGSDPANGYYASWYDQVPALAPGAVFDPILWGKTNWDKSDRAVLVETDAGGNQVRYVIHRLCGAPGALTAATQECVTSSDPTKGGTLRALEGGERVLAGQTQVYYRITARVDGPKNTVSIIQAMVY